MRVLIVDDEEVLRRLVRLTLEETHEITEAHDGPSALAAIRDHGPFDVVLLDQRLPGQSGVELMPEIRAAAATGAHRHADRLRVAGSGDLGAGPRGQPLPGQAADPGAAAGRHRRRAAARPGSRCRRCLLASTR